MRANCPYCTLGPGMSEVRFHVVRDGFFRRMSESKFIQRFKCMRCLKHFSAATGDPCFGQKKRRLNIKIAKDLWSTVSIRRTARNLGVSRTTVTRKFIFMGYRCLKELEWQRLHYQKATRVQFDELETFEHTKLKPLSVPLAVTHPERRILAFEVARMPAKGKLSQLSLKKYGKRIDERSKAMNSLFLSLKGAVDENALFESDENPHYPKFVRRHFPNASHNRFKGQRGSIVGQGELKKVRFDPLFQLNHTCAMLRANINRLVRKTWCTTKCPEKLRLHLAIYAHFHNNYLIDSC